MLGLGRLLIEAGNPYSERVIRMTEPKKLTPERLMQAKTFLDDGVITKDQFIEMTHGQADPLEENESQELAKIFDKINTIEQRLMRIETALEQLTQAICSQD